MRERLRRLPGWASRCLAPLLLLLALLLLLHAGPGAAGGAGVQPPTSLTGRLVDSHGEPVSRAHVRLVLNGRPAPAATGSASVHSPAVDGQGGLAQSQPDGTFVLEVPGEALGGLETLSVEVSRPHFKAGRWPVAPDQVERVNRGQSIRLPDWQLERRLTAGFWVATLAFAGMLAFIALDVLHSTMAALLGVAVVLGASLAGGAVYPDLYIFDFEGALEYVHFDVIFLILGMMIVISIIEETGIFQWLAYHAYRLSRGRPWLLVIILMLITSVASALLDNVTTMLLMTPITIQIAIAVGLNPLVLILPQVLASNVGGITTLIGTPTNILIGSYAGLSFNDFFTNLTPGVLLALVALVVYVLVRYRRQLVLGEERLSDELLNRLRQGGRITQPVKLRKSALVFGAMLFLFVFGEAIHLNPAVTAVAGAAVLLLWVGADIEEMLRVVDWTTLVFFICLFIVVGAVAEVGLISMVAGAIGHLVGGNLTLAVLVLVSSAALLSGIIDNVPFTAAMLPVAGYLSGTIPGASSQVLFYALSVGAAMGGNTTLIGSSANLVAAGVAQEAGYRITYLRFLKIGLPAMLITVTLGAIWLLVRF